MGEIHIVWTFDGWDESTWIEMDINASADRDVRGTKRIHGTCAFSVNALWYNLELTNAFLAFAMFVSNFNSRNEILFFIFYQQKLLYPNYVFLYVQAFKALMK